MIYSVIQKGNTSHILGIVNERTMAAAELAAEMRYGTSWSEELSQFVSRTLEVSPGVTQWEVTIQ